MCNPFHKYENVKKYCTKKKKIKRRLPCKSVPLRNRVRIGSEELMQSTLRTQEQSKLILEKNEQVLTPLQITISGFHKTT